MFCFYLSVITVLIGSPFLKVGMWAIGQFTGGGHRPHSSPAPAPRPLDPRTVDIVESKLYEQ